MEQLTLVGYTPSEKLQIAKRIHAAAAQGDGTGQGQGSRARARRGRRARPPDREYTREAGVRQLEREIQGVLRKAALEVVEGKSTNVRISSRISRSTRTAEGAERSGGPRPEIGVATGLAWTPTGGDIMFIEAIRMPQGPDHADRQLVIDEGIGTGRVEPARARAGALGIPLDVFTQSDVHLHVPAGGVPKDGPSAGITIATALASLLCRRPARHDFAMTGELTLRAGCCRSAGSRKS